MTEAEIEREAADTPQACFPIRVLEAWCTRVWGRRLLNNYDGLAFYCGRRSGDELCEGCNLSSGVVKAALDSIHIDDREAGRDQLC